MAKTLKVDNGSPSVAPNSIPMHELSLKVEYVLFPHEARAT